LLCTELGKETPQAKGYFCEFLNAASHCPGTCGSNYEQYCAKDTEFPFEVLDLEDVFRPRMRCEDIIEEAKGHELGVKLVYKWCYDHNQADAIRKTCRKTCNHFCPVVE